MSLKYETVKRAVKAVSLKNRGKMTAYEIIAFRKKQNTKIGIPDIRDKEIIFSMIRSKTISVSEGRTRAETMSSKPHRLKTVENADQIFVINHGEIVHHGRHSELMSEDGIYRRFIGERKEAAGVKRSLYISPHIP